MKELDEKAKEKKQKEIEEEQVDTIREFLIEAQKRYDTKHEELCRIFKIIRSNPTDLSLPNKEKIQEMIEDYKLECINFDQSMEKVRLYLVNQKSKPITITDISMIERLEGYILFQKQYFIRTRLSRQFIYKLKNF